MLCENGERYIFIIAFCWRTTTNKTNAHVYWPARFGIERVGVVAPEFAPLPPAVVLATVSISFVSLVSGDVEAPELRRDAVDRRTVVSRCRNLCQTRLRDHFKWHCLPVTVGLCILPDWHVIGIVVVVGEQKRQRPADPRCAAAEMRRQAIVNGDGEQTHTCDGATPLTWAASE